MTTKTRGEHGQRPHPVPRTLGLEGVLPAHHQVLPPFLPLPRKPLEDLGFLEGLGEGSQHFCSAWGPSGAGPGL